MNKIVESFLTTHIKEYQLESMGKERAFEHFVNRCVINKYSSDRFDPAIIMTEPGEKGLDGVAIIVNDRIVTEIEEIDSVVKSGSLDVRFIFIQAKTSDSFSGSEIGDFLYGVKAFFEVAELRPTTNEKMNNLIAIKDMIYSHSVDFIQSPIVDLFYVCCGKWDDGNGLRDRINIEIKPLYESQNFSSINFYPYDSEKIILTYKELKKKVVRSFPMEKRVTLPTIPGVTQAFLGVVQCKNFVSILRDSDGKMLTNIFEDNVRDFQGYNNVNREIKETLLNTTDQNRFALLNNGVTIVAKSIKPTGDLIELYDYQIVNGCQTSYVLFGYADKLNDNSYLVMKIIEVCDEAISERVIFTTNRQTEVKSEAFTSSKPFHRRLQDYYNAIEPRYRLFYERRSKQYDLDDNVAKNRVTTLATQVQSYLGIFLNEPHSTHRYYGELLMAYQNKLFLDTDGYELYYMAAYLTYYVDNEIRTGRIPKTFKKYKIHLACAIKSLEVGTQVIFGQCRKQKAEFDKLYALIKDEQKLRMHLLSAISCLDTAIAKCVEVPATEGHRSKEITKELLSNVLAIVKATKDTSYLKVGDIVHCVVTSMNDSFLYVQLKTDDSRNYGSIHISKVNGRYISNLSSEVSVSDAFQAKIVADFYESKFGWGLSRLY